MNFQRLWHWERFEPNIGDNLAAPEEQRLFLEVAVGLTKVELEKAMDAVKKLRAPYIRPVAKEDGKTVDEEATAAALMAMLDTSANELAAEWSPYLRLGPGEHAINGKPLTSLRDYLRFIVEQPGAFNVFELFEELGRLNSVEGTRALFSARPSGSITGTSRQSAAKAGSPKAVH